MKRIFALIIAAMILIAWGAVFYRSNTLPGEYSDLLQKSREACNEELYLEAQDILDEAERLTGVESKYEAAQLQRDIYLGLSNTKKYVSQLQDMITEYPEQVENYELLVKYYFEKSKYQELCACIDEYAGKWKDSQIIADIDNEFNKLITYKKLGYFDISYIDSSSVKIREREYELGDNDAQVVYSYIYDTEDGNLFESSVKDIVASEDGTAFFVADQSDNWTLVDINMNLIARNEEQSFEQIGRLGTNGVATAIVDGQKRYINSKMQVNNTAWDEFTMFSDNLAAVCKSGKWAFVSKSDLGTVTEFPYDDVAINDAGECVTEGKAVVKDSSGYYAIDISSFEPLYGNRFEQLKAYNSKQPVAYRSGDKWGFAYSDGSILTEALYEDARSYVNGYAAVKVNGLWGIVDKDNTMIIEPQYTDILDVLDNGYVYVKNEEGYWDLIIIEKLSYSSKL